MLSALLPVIMVLVGALMYALCVNAKLQRIGELMLAAGLFAIAFAYAGKMVSFFGHG